MLNKEEIEKIRCNFFKMSKEKVMNFLIECIEEEKNYEELIEQLKNKVKEVEEENYIQKCMIERQGKSKEALTNKLKQDMEKFKKQYTEVSKSLRTYALAKINYTQEILNQIKGEKE